MWGVFVGGVVLVGLLLGVWFCLGFLGFLLFFVVFVFWGGGVVLLIFIYFLVCIPIFFNELYELIVVNVVFRNSCIYEIQTTSI